MSLHPGIALSSLSKSPCFFELNLYGGGWGGVCYEASPPCPSFCYFPPLKNSVLSDARESTSTWEGGFQCSVSFSFFYSRPRHLADAWRREWLPTRVFLPREFHGQRSLEGYSPQGHKELDATEQLTLSLSFSRPSACGILVPEPGIEPRASAVKARSPNCWTTREFPMAVFLILKVLNKWTVQIFKVGTAEELSGLRAQQYPQRPQRCQRESGRRWFNWCKLPVGFGQWSGLNSVFPQNSSCLDPQNVILSEKQTLCRYN